MMYVKLLKYFLEQQRWASLSASEVRFRQTIKFRQIFEHARIHSPFYRRLYTEAGVANLEIRTFADIQRVPVVDKQMMRAYATEEIMTRPVTPELVKITTSGSTGEPFNIYQTKFEQYTSHLRVLGMLAALGYRPWHQILMLTRMESNAVLPVEQDLSILPLFRRLFKLFRREILSIYSRPEDIVNWIESWPGAKLFWSTPGITEILCDYLELHDIRFSFNRTILTSETLSRDQRKRFEARLGGKVLSHYGMMECPTVAFDKGADGRRHVFSNACMMELLNTEARNDVFQGEPVITNLVNWTMPFIRYNTHDTAVILNDPECPAKVIGPVYGRMDDVLTLSSGEGFAHHHAYAIFMDFSECMQFKFVQSDTGDIILRLRTHDGALQSMVREKAMSLWKEKYPSVPLQIEFVDVMPIDPKTGKFKNIERLRKDYVA